MSIRALRTFIAISKYGSFAATADHVGLTQAGVSLQIKKLEDEFQTLLFDRSAHKPVLNSQGQRLLKEAKEIVAHYDRIKGLIHQDKGFSGPLVIGTINTVQTSTLPPVLFHIQAAHPFLKISIKSGLSAELSAKLELGEIDLAITTEPPSHFASSLSWQAYCEEVYYVVAPKDFTENTAKGLLENHPYVCFDRQAWAGRNVENRLRYDGIITHESMELDSLEATLKMAQASLGVCLVSLSKQRRIEIEKTMKVIAYGSPVFSRKIGLMYRSENHWQALIKTFFETLTHYSQ